METRNLRWCIDLLMWCTVLSPIGLILLLAWLVDYLENDKSKCRAGSDRCLHRSELSRVLRLSH